MGLVYNVIAQNNLKIAQIHLDRSFQSAPDCMHQPGTCNLDLLQSKGTGVSVTSDFELSKEGHLYPNVDICIRELFPSLLRMSAS